MSLLSSPEKIYCLDDVRSVCRDKDIDFTTFLKVYMADISPEIWGKEDRICFVRNQASICAWLKDEAKAGIADSQYHVGLLHEWGLFRGRNGDAKGGDNLAARWYRMAVRQGHQDATSALAGVYADPNGSFRSMSDAFCLYALQLVTLQRNGEEQSSRQMDLQQKMNDLLFGANILSVRGSKKTFGANSMTIGFNDSSVLNIKLPYLSSLQFFTSILGGQIIADKCSPQFKKVLNEQFVGAQAEYKGRQTTIRFGNGEAYILKSTRPFGPSRMCLEGLNS